MQLLFEQKHRYVMFSIAPNDDGNYWKTVIYSYILANRKKYEKGKYRVTFIFMASRDVSRNTVLAKRKKKKKEKEKKKERER